MPRSRPKRRREQKPKSRKLSVMVIHRIKDTMALTSSVAMYKAKLAAAIVERYSPHLRPGEELPDYVLALELAVRDVQAALGHLIQLDNAVEEAGVAYDLLRLEQDRLVRDELYPQAVSVRGSIDLVYGRKDAVFVHRMKGRTRRRSAPLRSQVEAMVRRLRDGKLPTPKNPFAVVDREGWLRKLEEPCRKLVALNKEVVLRRDHVVPGLVRDKRMTLQAFDAAYRDALRQVRAAFAAARFDARSLKNLKPYYERRRLATRARSKRDSRAAAATRAAAQEAAAQKAEAPSKGPERVTVPKKMVQWLVEYRLFGT